MLHNQTFGVHLVQTLLQQLKLRYREKGRARVTQWTGGTAGLVAGLPTYLMPFILPFSPLLPGEALHSQTCNGSTPLHLAAREGLLSCVKVLVQKGANVHAQDATGCKPIDYCKIWNHRVCAR